MPIDVRVGNNWGDIENDIFMWQYELQDYEMLAEVS